MTTQKKNLRKNKRKKNLSERMIMELTVDLGNEENTEYLSSMFILKVFKKEFLSNNYLGHLSEEICRTC